MSDVGRGLTLVVIFLDADLRGNTRMESFVDTDQRG